MPVLAEKPKPLANNKFREMKEVHSAKGREVAYKRLYNIDNPKFADVFGKALEETQIPQRSLMILNANLDKNQRLDMLRKEILDNLYVTANFQVKEMSPKDRERTFRFILSVIVRNLRIKGQLTINPFTGKPLPPIGPNPTPSAPQGNPQGPAQRSTGPTPSVTSTRPVAPTPGVPSSRARPAPSQVAPTPSGPSRPETRRPEEIVRPTEPSMADAQREVINVLRARTKQAEIDESYRQRQAEQDELKRRQEEEAWNRKNAQDNQNKETLRLQEDREKKLFTKSRINIAEIFNDYEKHLDFMISIGQMTEKRKQELLNTLQRQIPRLGAEKARNMITKILENDRTRMTPQQRQQEVNERPTPGPVTAPSQPIVNIGADRIGAEPIATISTTPSKGIGADRIGVTPVRSSERGSVAITAQEEAAKSARVALTAERQKLANTLAARQAALSRDGSVKITERDAVARAAREAQAPSVAPRPSEDRSVGITAKEEKARAAKELELQKAKEEAARIAEAGRREHEIVTYSLLANELSRIRNTLDISDVKTAQDLEAKLKLGQLKMDIRMVHNMIAENIDVMKQPEIDNYTKQLYDAEDLLYNLKRFEENIDKFSPQSTQELLFWLKTDVDRNWLGNYITFVINGEKGIRPLPDFFEKIGGDAKDWGILNKYANDHDIVGEQRVKFLFDWQDETPENLRSFIEDFSPETPESLEMPNPVPLDVLPEPEVQYEDPELERIRKDNDRRRDMLDLIERESDVLGTVFMPTNMSEFDLQADKLASDRVAQLKENIQKQLKESRANKSAEDEKLEPLRKQIKKDYNVLQNIVRLVSLLNPERRKEYYDALDKIMRDTKSSDLETNVAAHRTAIIVFKSFLETAIDKLIFEYGDYEKVIKENKKTPLEWVTNSLESIKSRLAELPEYKDVLPKIEQALQAKHNYVSLRTAKRITHDIETLTTMDLRDVETVFALRSRYRFQQMEDRLLEFDRLLADLTVNGNLSYQNTLELLDAQLSPNRFHKAMKIIFDNPMLFNSKINELLTILKTSYTSTSGIDAKTREVDLLEEFVNTTLQANQRKTLPAPGYSTITNEDIAKDVAQMLIDLRNKSARTRYEAGLVLQADIDARDAKRQAQQARLAGKETPEETLRLDRIARRQARSNKRINDPKVQARIAQQGKRTKVRGEVLELDGNDSSHSAIAEEEPVVLKDPNQTEFDFNNDVNAKIGPTRLAKTEAVISELQIQESFSYEKIPAKQEEQEKRKINKALSRISKKYGMDINAANLERIVIRIDGIVKIGDFTLKPIANISDGVYVEETSADGSKKMVKLKSNQLGVYSTNRLFTYNIGTLYDSISVRNHGKQFVENLLGLLIPQKDGSMVVYRPKKQYLERKKKDESSRIAASTELPKGQVDLFGGNSESVPERDANESEINENTEGQLDLFTEQQKKDETEKSYGERLAQQEVQKIRTEEEMYRQRDADELLDQTELKSLEQEEAAEVQQQAAYRTAAGQRDEINRQRAVFPSTDYAGPVTQGKELAKYVDKKTLLLDKLSKAPTIFNTLKNTLENTTPELARNPEINPIIEGEVLNNQFVIPANVLGPNTIGFPKNHLVILGRNNYTVIDSFGKVETFNLDKPLVRDISRYNGIFMLTDEGLVCWRLSKYNNKITKINSEDPNSGSEKALTREAIEAARPKEIITPLQILEDPRAQIFAAIDRLPTELKDAINLRIGTLSEEERKPKLIMDPLVLNDLIELRKEPSALREDGNTLGNNYYIPAGLLTQEPINIFENHLYVIGRNKLTIVKPDGKIEIVNYPRLPENVSGEQGAFMLTSKGFVSWNFGLNKNVKFDLELRSKQMDLPVDAQLAYDDIFKTAKRKGLTKTANKSAIEAKKQGLLDTKQIRSILQAEFQDRSRVAKYLDDDFASNTTRTVLRTNVKGSATFNMNGYQLTVTDNGITVDDFMGTHIINNLTLNEGQTLVANGKIKLYTERAFGAFETSRFVGTAIAVPKFYITRFGDRLVIHTLP